MNDLGFLLSAAEGYASMASNIFSIFLTVMFSSFAFAAALPLRNIGARIKIFSLRLSSSSIWIGVSLLAFYIISFTSFYKTTEKAKTLIGVIRSMLDKGTNINKDVLQAFETDPDVMLGLGLPSIGFIIGSTIGLSIFLWITNAERPTSSKP
ncbi:MAG: energy-coupling factor transporter transmembrane protein EcfT [Cellvibrionaceae bacterium]|jgi:energy-coupling factor transporter transmembrane protein EcfT